VQLELGLVIKLPCRWQQGSITEQRFTELENGLLKLRLSGVKRNRHSAMPQRMQSSIAL